VGSVCEDGQRLNWEEITTQIEPVLAHHFKPALLARMQPIVYLPLGAQVLSEIIDSKLALLQKNFAEIQGIDFVVSATAKEHLQNLCHEGSTGARLIDQVIARHILPQIARMILVARLEDQTLSRVEMGVDDAGNFYFSENGQSTDDLRREDKKSKRRKSGKNQAVQSLNQVQAAE